MEFMFFLMLIKIYITVNFAGKDFLTGQYNARISHSHYQLIWIMMSMAIQTDQNAYQWISVCFTYRKM